MFAVDSWHFVSVTLLQDSSLLIVHHASIENTISDLFLHKYTFSYDSTQPGIRSNAVLISIFLPKQNSALGLSLVASLTYRGTKHPENVL